jgi:hypothetical protein
VQLVAADTLLAASHKVDGLQPQVQLNMAAFKDGANANGELLAAVFAFFEAMALYAFWVFLGCLRANALQFVCVIDNATSEADRTIRPEHTLNVRKGCGFVVHVRGG